MRINCAGESGIVYRILIVDDEKSSGRDFGFCLVKWIRNLKLQRP